MKNPEYATEIEMWSINPLADLISPSAWLRQVSIWLFSYDPFEGWAKQFSGDWDSYVHCAVAWGHIGGACSDIGRNLTAGAAEVPSEWRGNAADAEQEYQLVLFASSGTRCSRVSAPAGSRRYGCSRVWAPPRAGLRRRRSG